VGVVAAAVVGAVIWFTPSGPRPLRADAILAAFDPDHPPGRLNVQYPFDEAVFPDRIAAPTFRWEDTSGQADAWLVHIQFPGEVPGMSFECSAQDWTPSASQWDTIQRHSLGGRAAVTVLGVRRVRQGRVRSSATISISTSPDEIGAPIFYREVNLPFRDAVNDPSQIRWRFGDVASRQPPRVVLQDLPVCGNCHSFSADGKTLGMDVDYSNDKGSYAILPVGEQMTLEPSKIITWSDYKREDGVTTFGLLSQVSPDGKYVASTVKDGSVFVPRPDLAFSQLFFPIKGIVGIYSLSDGKFQALPGADDPQYVQSNPVWSPDGKWIVFARSKRYRMEGHGLLNLEECKVFTHEGRTFLFDLYRIPFNGGRGGRAEPLVGASHNGMSNYFPRFSPDGKWIVFCKAKTFMLLQPDSELYIVPSGGGEARRLRCNTSRMNSWHSWSPNGKWMVFSSKTLSLYTQLFLTHFDGAGQFSPPVLLANFTAPGRAANIPEFVHAAPDAIQQISEHFLDDHSYSRQAETNIQFEDLSLAEKSCRKALALNPKNTDALRNLGVTLTKQGRAAEAVEPYQAALKQAPDLFEARFALGMLLLHVGRTSEAVESLEHAVRLRPADVSSRHCLGLALQGQGKFEQALAQYARVLELDPSHAPSLAQSALLRATCPLQELRNYDAAVRMAEQACTLTQFSQPEILAILSRAYAQGGRRPEAVMAARRAVEVARRIGREDLARRFVREFQELGRN
jgi:tetratricopeptide (TPR) repeat protein